jgi:hypothetical protein
VLRIRIPSLTILILERLPSGLDVRSTGISTIL